MKRAYLILVLSLLLSELMAASDSLFQSANLLYQEGKYEKALEDYRQISESGLESADLYYNMGNAAYRSNSIGYAILYYEKALKMEPTHDDASHNLDFAARYQVDTFEQVPELFLRIWMRLMLQSMSERTWSILALIFFVLILFSFLLYLFSHRLTLKKLGFFLTLASGFLFVITFSSALSRHRSIVKPDAAIVIAPSIIVRSTPSETGNELFILHEGTKVKVIEKVSEWQNIRVIDGREGWIRISDFESI